jgi:hypothetical protein
MAVVMIRCPVTGDEIPTGIEADEVSFTSAIFENKRIKCASCDQWHSWSKGDAFLR